MQTRMRAQLIGVAVLIAGATTFGCEARARSVSSFTVEPSTTGDGITAETEPDKFHYVAVPDGGRRDLLTVFLAGSLSQPSNTEDLTDAVAGHGYGTVNLRYPNDLIIGWQCHDDDACFRDVRGETLFGAGVAYARGHAPYDSPLMDIDAANSIVGRLVSLLDHLGRSDGYWSQFLVDDPASPYATTHRGPVYPDWSKITIAGHSQGGAHAAFLAMQLQVRRVVMLASPNDHVLDEPASWITATSATPLTDYWGIRHVNDDFGGHVQDNWSAMGGIGVGGIANGEEVDIDDGDGDPLGCQRLVVSEPDGDNNHGSMAVDDKYPPGMPTAWGYVFTGGGDDDGRGPRGRRRCHPNRSR